MPKVKCMDCRFWWNSGRTIKRRLYYFDFLNPTRTKGQCDNTKCAEETSGYTGMASGHKMSREGEVERYCKFFEPIRARTT